MTLTLIEQITGAYNLQGAKLTHYDGLSFRLILGVYPDTGNEFLLQSQGKGNPLLLIADLKKETDKISTFSINGVPFQFSRIDEDEVVISMLD
jgi:hypothetical protein